MNVYLLIGYFAMLVLAVGFILLKIEDILEKKRDRKYYQMFKEDAAFWQMKVEQSGTTIGDNLVDKYFEGMAEAINEPKEDEELKKIFDGMEDDIII